MAMKLPSLDELEHVTSLLWKQSFLELDDTRKLQIVAIAQQGVLAEVLSDLPTDLLIGIEETIVRYGSQLKDVREALEGIDASMSHVGDWFEKSRLYEP